MTEYTDEQEDMLEIEVNSRAFSPASIRVFNIWECPVCRYEVRMPIRIQTKDGYYTPCLNCLVDVLRNLGIPEMKEKK